MISRNRVIEDRLVYDGFWSVRRVAIEAAAGGGRVERFERDVMQASDAAAVLLFDPARSVVTLVRQFRVAPFVAHGEIDLIEACAGLIDGDETPEACALREAREETGLAVASARFVARLYTSPGVCTERVNLFIATYDESARVSTGGGLAQEGEDIEPIEIPLAEALAMIDTGAISDAKTVILLQRLWEERARA